MTWVIIFISVGIAAHLATAFNPFLPDGLRGQVRLVEQNFKNLPPLSNVVHFRPNLDSVAPAVLKDLIHSNKVDLFLEKFARKIKTEENGDACTADIKEWVTQLDDLTAADTWALHMVDAWGKLPSGILSGNLGEPGDFYQCINLRGQVNRTREIRGKYCTAHMLPMTSFKADKGAASEIMDAVSYDDLAGMLLQGTMPSIGTCFPASCSQEEIRTALRIVYELTNRTILPSVWEPCTTADKPDLDGGDYTMIILLSVIAGLCFLATVVDMTFEPKAEGGQPKETGLPVKLLLAFSLYTNTRKWLDTRTGSDNVGCLHGLRFLSISWIVLCHTWGMIRFQPTANQFETLDWYKNWSFYPILNGTPAVDTFFCMSGVLLAYNILREMDKTGGRFNYPLLVVHRFLRLTPTYMFIVGMMATILPYISTGPRWYAMESMSDGCTYNWWHNMLYVNNLVNYTGKEHGECYGEGWYVANDMQFFLLAPAVIYILWKWNKLGYGLLAALSFIPIVSTPVIMEKEYERPTILPLSGRSNFMANIYTKPWTRCGPYIVGLLLGYVLYLRKKSPKSFQNIPRVFIAIGWMLSTALALAIIFGPMNIFDPENDHLSRTAWYSFMYGALHRYAWGVVISCIIFACVNGNGGLINDFLSWKVFVPLGRLTFCMYVSSYHMQMVYHLSQVRPAHISVYQLVYWFFAHLVCAGILAYVLMITLESPFIQLEKLILPATSKQLPPLAKLPEFDANGNMAAAETAISINNNETQGNEKPKC